MVLSLGRARPMLAAMRRCGSFVEFSLITVNATCPGLRCFNPSLREINLQLGGKMEETRTMLQAAIPALRRANSKLESLSRCFPTPLVRKIFFATNAILLGYRPSWIFAAEKFFRIWKSNKVVLHCQCAIGQLSSTYAVSGLIASCFMADDASNRRRIIFRCALLMSNLFFAHKEELHQRV